MNCALADNFLDNHKEELDQIMSIHNPVHERKKDALIKWTSIMDAYKLLDLSANTLVDIGCGCSSLVVHFKKTVPNVIGIDVDKVNGWYPILEQNNIQFIHKGVRDVDEIAENSVDVIIDSCSIGCSMNMDHALEKIGIWLKPGGYFITSGDTDVNELQQPFPNADVWIEKAKANNLELLGELDRNIENAFMLHYGRYKLNIFRLVFRKPL